MPGSAMWQEQRSRFIKTFNGIARHKHRFEVFKDFVTMSAISLHNAVAKSEELEAEYMEIVKRYKREEVSQFPRLLANLVNMLEDEPHDALGGLYMELELGNTQNGQFFTPCEVSTLMAKLNYDDQIAELDKPFITLEDPACGAGGMILAFVKVMLGYQHNPSERLWARCVDVDRTAALMCYIQLSLWYVPAQIVVGNSLTLEVRETWHTPAHYVDSWDAKLRLRNLYEQVNQLINPEKMPATNEVAENRQQETPSVSPMDDAEGGLIQFDLGF